MTSPPSRPLLPPLSALGPRLAWITVLAALYVIAGRLGLGAGLVDTNITLVWPPTGFAIAALWRGGLGLWPGVAIGAFLLNWWIGMPVVVALGTAVGNTLGPVLTVVLLRRLSVHPDFDRRRDVGWFCLAIAIGLLIPPTIGVACLAVSGVRAWTGTGWLLWWLGDMVGALVVAPLLLTTHRRTFRPFTDRYHAIEFVLLSGGTVAIGFLIFIATEDLAVTFLGLPLVLLSALRFGCWGSSLTVVLIAVLGVIGTATHRGPFADPNLQSFLLLTAYLTTAALLSLLLSALLGERQSAEVALRGGLERLRMALDHAHMVTCEVDMRLLRLTWGVRAETLFGSEPGAIPLTMDAFFMRVHPDDQAHLQAAMAKGMAGTPPLSYAVEYRVVRLDGTTRWIASVGEFLLDPAGHVASTSGVSYEITDRRQSEQALRESELRNRTLVDHSPEAIAVFDLDQGRFCDANPRACEMFGLTREQLLTSDPITLSPPHQPDGQSSMSAAHSFLSRASAGEVPRFEWVHRDQRGTDFPCEVWLVRLPSAGRTLIRGTIVDISERKQAQAALHASEERLRLAFAAAGLGAWEIDLASDAMTWSPECSRLHRLASEQAPRTTAEFYALIADDHRTTMQDAIRHAITSLTPMQCEYRTHAIAGTEQWFTAYARCLCDPQGRAMRIIGVVMDVSARHHADVARQRLEAHLFQAQKLEAIGTLAGGIAHDFNNILAAIIGNIELAGHDLMVNRSVQPRLDNILAASHRARDLVRQILAFSRQQSSIRSVVRLEPLVHEVAALLRASLPATVAMEVVIEPHCPAVRADASQMHQVLLNLCTNAWQALPAQRGQLTIMVSPVALDALRVQALPGLAPGLHLRLSVSDTGTGIEPATQARIFEPFFTTKATGQGTGLGLAVVHGIVQAHDGAIVVDSQIGTGTTFHVYLPAVAPVATTIPIGAVALSPGQGQHIVFVDDEPALVELGKDLLSDLGYRVTGFTSPQAALTALRERPHDVDLLISDLTMPEMSGLELARALLALRADLPIIIATGYSGALTQEQVQTTGIRALLIKPAVLETLAATVHEQLNRK